ncbi:MAG: hypothetical protein R6U59_08190 [Eubacteriales bacterium]
MVKKKSRTSTSKPKTFGSLRKEYEKAMEKAKSENKQKELTKKYSEDKKELTKQKFSEAGKSAGSFFKGASTLSKPKAKLPSYSAKKFIAGLADQQEGLVSPYDRTRARYENPEVDNRSLYFRDTFKKEKKKAFGGFI